MQSIITDHVARFGVRAEILHAGLQAIENKWEQGASNSEIASWFQHQFPNVPYSNEQVVSEFTDILEHEETIYAVHDH